MNKNLFLSVLYASTSALYPFGTTVHLRNNTPFTFTVTVEQKGTSLEKKHWGIYQKTVGSYQSADIVGIGRNVGIKDGKEYIFISTLKVTGTPAVNGDQNIVLAQKVRGAPIGSKLWWGFSCGQFDNKWYDGNDKTWSNPLTCTLKSPVGDLFIQVKYKSHYWTGKKDPYDDVTYVFSMPDAPSGVRFDQGYYLTSHNAFASTKEGYLFAQQNLSIMDQLKYGARGLMLDTYEKGGKVVLAHGGLDTDKLIHPGKGPRLLADLLKEMDKFIADNPQAIITIFLENYVNSEQLLNDAFNVLKQYLFTPNDFYSYGWPSLDWMRRNNKRVVVFCPHAVSAKFFDEWRYHIENQFSTVDVKEAAKERGSSKNFIMAKRTLYVFNFFPAFKITEVAGTASEFSSINSGTLKEALAYAMQNGLDGQSYKGMRPNFIAIDYINVGAGLEIISKWNGEML